MCGLEIAPETDVVVCKEPTLERETSLARKGTFGIRLLLGFACFAVAWLVESPVRAQEQIPSWQAQVKKYAEAQDWASAMKIVDREVDRAPRDMDVRAWRARVLAWSGRLAEAEKEYLEVLKFSRTDPDNWVGLANVYAREGKISEARRAIATALELDANRADLHEARARILLSAGEHDEARKEFRKALNLDPTNAAARAGLNSLRSEPKHELRLGQDNDLFNFTGANHDEWTSLVSRWTPRWTTTFAENIYQRGSVEAAKFMGSVTLRQSKWGALTLGAAVGHDNAVIPKREAFFELDHGWKTGETNFVRGVEFVYGQHWYWYQTAQILTLNGTATIYLPRDWTLILAATGAQSFFFGIGRGMAALWPRAARISACALGREEPFRKSFLRGGNGRLRARGSDRAVRFTNLRRGLAVSDYRPAGHHGIRRLSEAHTRQVGHKFWNELWHPFLKSSGGWARRRLY